MLLFAYGTLKDREIQRILYGREVVMQDATASDTAIFGGDDGFYFLKAFPEGNVQGKILELSGDEIALTDAWEAVPEFYIREHIPCRTNAGQVSAYAYLRPWENGTPISSAPASFCTKPLSEVYASTRAWRENYRT